MEKKHIENPAYRNEDLAIENKDELNLAKFEAGVKSHEEVLKEAFAHGVKTGDNLLIQNSIDMIKEVGVTEFLMKSGKKEENGEAKRDKGTEESARLQDLMKDVSVELAEGDPKEGIRIEKRLNLLYEKWGDIKRAITQIEFEKKEQKNGRPIISSIQCQGVIEQIIRNPEDIARAIPNRDLG